MALRQFGSLSEYLSPMSCNACQEQHLLKRCLSDGQKCAGANTDSMHTGGYSILKGRVIIFMEHTIFLALA